jgi:hypothetical protein
VFSVSSVEVSSVDASSSSGANRPARASAERLTDSVVL